MNTSQNLKQFKTYKKGNEVKFKYYYEDKIGEITEVLDNNKYFIKSNNIEYPVHYDNIYGKIIPNGEKESDTAQEGSNNLPKEK